MKPKKLSDLQPDPMNPRFITDESLEALKTSLEKFGDISGIVFNTRTGYLVGGHQRIRALREKYGDAVKFDAKKGIVRTPDGDFPVRFVDWEEDFAQLANVIANSPEVAGEFSDAFGSIAENLAATFPELSTSLRLEELRSSLGFKIDELKVPGVSGEGFAGGEQFKKGGTALVEMKVVREKAESEDFRVALEAFCKQNGDIPYRIR